MVVYFVHASSPPTLRGDPSSLEMGKSFLVPSGDSEFEY